MPSYKLLIHRYGRSWPAPGIRRTLEVLERELPSFYPADLPVAPGRSLSIARADDFREADVPKEFIVQEEHPFVHVPFYGARGEKLTILDQSADFGTSTVILEWATVEQLPPSGVMKGLLGALATALEADWGAVRDKPVRRRDVDIDKASVPDALYWMNWFGPMHLSVIGSERLTQLGSFAEIEPRPPHGALVVLQEEPPSDADPAHVKRREKAEEALELTKLHQQYLRHMGGGTNPRT